ncbi:MAG: hypothetical protein KAR19_17435 [Bacteroidales bacterium]|nr:hypothetical protein [Bacteroidales bacterium]
MDDIFSYGWTGIKRFVKVNLVAILYTLIFHLVVLIILVFMRVEGLKRDQELGIKLEFEEKTIEEILAGEEVDIPAEWIELIMQQRELSSNRAVNLNAENQFSEEISTDDYVQDLIDQIELARNQEDREKLEELQSILASADYLPPEKESTDENPGDYTGPTTITYEFLDEPTQRGKVLLTVPVYRCQGSGLVRVEIIVARDGSVLSAKVKEPIEGADRVCFADAALAAARSSRFRIEISAPEKQRAMINYTFIAQ